MYHVSYLLASWYVILIFFITYILDDLICRILTEVDNLQGVPPTGGEGETMVTP